METVTASEHIALFASLRHDLKTPINGIIGYSDLLLEEVEEKSNALHLMPNLKRIRRYGSELLSVIDSTFAPNKFDCDDFVSEIQKVGISVRFQMQKPLDAVVSSCEELLSNVSASEWASDLTKIHDSALKLRKTTDEIVNFSEQHLLGANIISAEFKDKTITARGLELGSVKDVLQTMHSLKRNNSDSTTHSSGTILVVDDNETNRHLLCRQLTRQGHCVDVASNGMTAIEMLVATQYDLILLDLVMPGINGFEVLRQLKANPEVQHIPVIMISAADQLENVVGCIKIGADDYLTKPFNLTLLQARISACLEKKQLRDREKAHLKLIEEERQRSDQLLEVILPRQVIQELKSNGVITPRRYEKVAVMFADIVGFTRYCENNTPENVMTGLEKLMGTFEVIAERHQLEKLKTIGDAFMATGGLLKSVENPVLQCVKAGLEMVEASRLLSIGWRIRIGIHFGDLMAGVVGRKKFLFDVWGDTVNTASRVESHGVAGAVNVSSEAWNDVADICQGYSRGVIEIKGKGKLELMVVQRLRS